MRERKGERGKEREERRAAMFKTSFKGVLQDVIQEANPWSPQAIRGTCPTLSDVAEPRRDLLTESVSQSVSPLLEPSHLYKKDTRTPAPRRGREPWKACGA